MFGSSIAIGERVLAGQGMVAGAQDGELDFRDEDERIVGDEAGPPV